MYTLGEGGGKLNIRGLDHSGSETTLNVHSVFNYRGINVPIYGIQRKTACSCIQVANISY